MPSIIKDGDGGIDIILHVRGYQFTQSYTLAADIAALCHTGVEETQLTAFRVGHPAYIVASVAFCGGVEQLGTCINIAASENVADYFVAVNTIVKL
ncbi:MAG: hypothetical protein MJ000_12175 [Bacteroidales bacterium]|nr:hypothetical protein [Bacteroidales bacterium]